METVGVEPTPPRCKRGALPPELHPQVRTGGVEPPQCETSGLQPVELTHAQRPRVKGGRPDSNRNFEDHDLGCCRYTTTTTCRCRLRTASADHRLSRRNRTPGNHHGPRGGPDSPAESGDDRTRTGACSPDKRVLLPLSYVPLDSAGGIRTHGLELMRLAGTATPLRRDLPGWSRTSDLRRPKPAGWPISPTGSRDTPGGTRTRSFRIESPASYPFDHRGVQVPRMARSRTPVGNRPRADAGFAGVGRPRPESRRHTDRSHHGSAKPSRTSIGESSGARARTWASRLTVARLAARLHRNGKAEGEGVEPPRPKPTRFRDGIPHQMAVLPRGDPGRARTCTTPIKSRPLYRIELRSQKCGRQESNLQRPAFQAGALPIWSYDHASGRGWNRTSDLLFVRQALGLSELLARVKKWAELESNQPPPPYQRGARPTELPALDVGCRCRLRRRRLTRTKSILIIRSKSPWLGAAEPDFDR